MKAISFFVLLTALTISCLVGQSTDRWAFDTITAYNIDDGMTRIIFTYNVSEYSETRVYQDFVENQWKNKKRWISTKNADGFSTNVINQAWVNDHWEESSHITRTYNENNKILSYTTNNARTLYQYDNSNQLSSQLSQQLVNEIWENSRLHTYQYDSANRLVSKLWQSWINNQWEDYMLYTYGYDENNNLTFCIETSWSSNGESKTKTFYAYNTNNLKTEEIKQYYNLDSSRWINSSKQTWSYDAGNRCLEYKYFITETDVTWTESWGDTYTYDSNTNLLSSLIRTREQVPSKKDSFTYNENNDILVALYQTWYAGDRWLPVSSLTYTYDAQKNRLSEHSQYYENLIWYDKYYYSWQYDEHSNCILTLYKRWDLNISDWAYSNEGTVKLFYNNMQDSCNYSLGGRYKAEASYKKAENTGIVPLQNATITIYPNPAHSQFMVSNVESANLSLYNIFGQKVKQLTAKEDLAVIQTENLPSGIYFLRIEKEKNVVVKKVQLMR